MYNQKQNKSQEFWTIVGAIITANIITIIAGLIIFSIFASTIMNSIGGGY